MCLKDEGPSNKERVELLLGLKADLEKEGFRVSWRNPFFGAGGQFSEAGRIGVKSLSLIKVR
jgi:hypothetical protein